PITAVIIVLELTQSYTYAVAVMVSVMLCSLITNRLFGQSFFDRQLLDRGIDLLKGREAIALRQKNIGAFICQNYVRATGQTSGQEICEQMKSRGQTEAYIVDDTGVLLGKTSLYAAIEAADSSIERFMDTRPAMLYSHNSLDESMLKVRQFVGESLPVVDAETGKLEGSITEGALFQAVTDVQNQARTLERA
ncbi:MAG: voltage-gated chloride channel, partial [Porticoccaceae bacterium]